MKLLAHFIVDKEVFTSPSPAKNFITKITDLESVSSLDYEFTIAKSDLGRLEVGNFWYNYQIQYDFKSKEGKAYRIKVGNIECVDFSIRQLKSDYADDISSVKVKFKANGIADEVLIHGGGCQTPSFIGAIIDFMKNFEQNFSTNWAYYNKVKELEKTNEALAKQVSDLEKQLQKLKPITK